MLLLLRSRSCGFLAGVIFLGSAALATATGLTNDADARAAALGGAAVAEEGRVLGAMDANPAALASLARAEVAVTLTGALLNGTFHQPTATDPEVSAGQPATASRRIAPASFPCAAPRASRSN